ncbi:MAG: adenylyltransferase/cytidyltransferase family protein [Parachlamydiales bacterium]|jgi:rfaE bifunctional protein nucleotidyltransferase chain/domain
MENSWEKAAQKKIVPPEELEQKLGLCRSAGKSVASLNGSFDLLHAGHLQILYEASRQADILVVALNSDRSIQAYKSLHRPIVPLKYRLEMIAALSFVDLVTWFDETDPREILNKIRPDVHVNGAEYGSNCLEAEVLKKLGARLHLVARIPALATSALIEKIKQCD